MPSPFDSFAGFRQTVFPTSEGAALDRAQGAATSRSLVMRRLSALQQQGLEPGGVLKSLLASEEFAQALADPGIDAEALQKLVLSSVQGFQPPRGVAGSMAIAPGGQPIPGSQVPEQFAPSAPAAAVQLVDAIIAADARGDTKRADLLKRQLKQDPAGVVGSGDALKMRAAGVAKTGNDVVDMITAPEAQTALELGRKAEGPETISINDLAVRATGAKVGKANVDALKPEVAEIALKTRGELLGAEDFMKAFFSKAAGGASGAASGTSPAAAFRATGASPTAAPSGATGAIDPATLTPGAVGTMSPEAAMDLSRKALRGEVRLPPETATALSARLRAIGAQGKQGGPIAPPIR